MTRARPCRARARRRDVPRGLGLRLAAALRRRGRPAAHRLARLARGPSDRAPGRAAALDCRRAPRGRRRPGPRRARARVDARSRPAITLVERYEKLGERRTQLRRDGRHLWARYVLRRCRAAVTGSTRPSCVVEDPFGLERREPPPRGDGALVVYPRLVELERLFSEVGAHARDGRRAAPPAPERVRPAQRPRLRARATRCARCTGGRRRAAAS